MKIISVYRDYKERNLSNSTKVNRIIGLIDVGSACEVTIDLSNCLIDYPYTARIIDRVLTQLSELNCPVKRLHVQYDFSPSEEITLNYLFVGSYFFDIQESKACVLATLKGLLQQKLKNNNIYCSVDIADKNGLISQSIVLNS